jgi:hypothetical protein
MFEILRRQYPQDISDEEIKCIARVKGWTNDNNKHFSRELEIFQDGKTYKICPYCDVFNPLHGDGELNEG